MDVMNMTGKNHNALSMTNPSVGNNKKVLNVAIQTFGLEIIALYELYTK